MIQKRFPCFRDCYRGPVVDSVDGVFVSVGVVYQGSSSGLNAFRWKTIQIYPGFDILKYMKRYLYTDYFENEVLRKRPFIKKEWCERIIDNPLKVEPQENNRFRFWGIVDDFEGKVFRVVTLSDKRTIHNAFPDRGFKHENQIL